MEIDYHEGVLNLAKVELIKLTNKMREVGVRWLGLKCIEHDNECLKISEEEILTCIFTLNKLYELGIKSNKQSGRLHVKN